MSRAISIIKQEHLNYLALLQCLGHLADEASESRSAPDLTLFHSIIDYIESFHDYLFRALVKRHPESGALIQRLQGEHAEGEVLLRDLKDVLAACEGGGEPDWIGFADAVGRYREHQYNHMRSEEMEALPLAREHLSAEDWQEIDAAFLAHDDPGPRRPPLRRRAERGLPSALLQDRRHGPRALWLRRQGPALERPASIYPPRWPAATGQHPCIPDTCKRLRRIPPVSESRTPAY
jgi:branched-chain amino acid transport system ATP-binding protein